MYICVRVSQEDFFFWWRHKKSRSYQTIFNLVYYLGKFSTECFHLFLPWQPLVFDCSYVVSYGHIIAQRKAMQNLFKVKYFLTEVTKQWPPSFLIMWRHPTPVLKTDACIILNPLMAVLSFPRLWLATDLQLKSLTDECASVYLIFTVIYSITWLDRSFLLVCCLLDWMVEIWRNKTYWKI